MRVLRQLYTCMKHTPIVKTCRRFEQECEVVLHTSSVRDQGYFERGLIFFIVFKNIKMLISKIHLKKGIKHVFQEKAISETTSFTYDSRKSSHTLIILINPMDES